MSVRVMEGDCRAILATLPPQSVQCCVTSPPYYGLRDYGVAGQMGLEPNLGDYIAGMVDVFREVRRVLADDGVLWLNVGDSYNAYNGNRGASMSISANTNEAVAKLPSGAGLTEKAFKAKDLRPYFQPGTHMIKVIDGLPGDLVKVTKEQVLVNGSPVGEGLQLSKPLKRPEGRFVREEIVPDSKYWFMGKTLDSFDSRYWGYVSKDDLIGRAYPVW